MSDADGGRRVGSATETLKENTRRLNRDRYEAISAASEYEQYRTAARQVKEEAIERLPELIERTRRAVEDNGGSVYVADDADDASGYVEDLLEARDADSVVKSKSMTTEEIDLNETLGAAGVEVWETDLGEFVIQVAEDHPSHIVGPALHVSREEITDLFQSRFDPDRPLDSAEELTAFAREFLGERIAAADVGITGANFVIAETGTIVLVTNEGNARKCATLPDTHVAVAGIEKIIPTIADLHPFAETISRASTGQSITQYLSMLTPPTDTPAIDFDAGADAALGDGERSFHLVLVDNGRTEMRDDDGLRETLYCIRCGACANSCGNFQSVGGHAFGGETYTGGIATGWEAGVEGLDVAAEFNDLCTGCSRCVNACPVKIDIPWINTVVRDRINRSADPGFDDLLVDGLVPDDEQPGLSLDKRFFGNFETVARVGSATAPLSNALAGTRPVRWLMERTLGVDARRDLPDFERTTLREWARDRESRPAAGDGDRRVVLYPDVYTNYIQTGRGKAAVRVLEALGCTVEVPAVGGSGRAPLSQGMIATAESKARDVAASLEPYLADGYDVVVVEPSDHAMFESEYGKLLDADASQRLADASYEVFEYVYGLLENGADAGALARGDGTGVAYHSHCQQRTLGVETYTEAVLDRLGYDVVTSDVECCGMAGSFGYKSDYYEVSVDVGEELADQFGPVADERAVVASGTSCVEQLDALLGTETGHPIELLDPAR